MKDVALRIRALRLQKGMTVTELAEASGCTLAYLWGIENMEVNRRIGEAFLYRVADVLECDIDDLFGRVKRDDGPAT